MEDSQKGGQYLCNCDTQGLQGATTLSRGGQHQGSLCWRKVCFLENMALKQVFMWRLISQRVCNSSFVHLKHSGMFELSPDLGSHCLGDHHQGLHSFFERCTEAHWPQFTVPVLPIFCPTALLPLRTWAPLCILLSFKWASSSRAEIGA